MKPQYFKSKLFLKYFWSHLFILIIPLILITGFIYENAVSNLRNEIQRSHLNQLTQTKNTIDDRMKELNDIASRVSFDERLTPYRVHDPYFSREAIQALDQYGATSSIIDELFLYFHNDDQIYSSQGMSDLEVFMDRYNFQNWTLNDLTHDLNAVQFPKMRPADSMSYKAFQQSTLAYLVPIKPNHPNPHGTVMYFIEEAKLTELIDSILGNYSGISYIFDENGQILANNHQDESLLKEEAESTLGMGLTPGIHSQDINGKPHFIVSVTSELNGWTYVTLMPSSQFFSSVLHVRSFIIMLFIIIVLVGVAIAILLARIQYQPISLLAEFANSNANLGTLTNESNGTGNELERIRSALLDFMSKVDIQEPYARNHFLFMLLKYGNLQSQSTDHLETFDLRFNRTHHFVILFSWRDVNADHNDPEAREMLLNLLSRLDMPQLEAQAYLVELPQPDQLALIVSFDLDDTTEESEHLQLVVEYIRNYIVSHTHVVPTMGIGTIYASPDQLNQSFIEAYSAYDLRSSIEMDTITFFKQISYKPDHSFWIPDNVLQKLSQSLKLGSYDVAEQMIRPAIRNLYTADISPLLMRCIYFDILNTMLKTATEIGVDNTILDTTPQLLFNSLDELELSYLNLASLICAQVERDQMNKEHSIIDQVIGYIDTHYMDNTLSLESISSEFDISPSHISRSFKEKMDINFIQYIWQKRLELVIHYLTTTSDPLKDIIIRAGYLDAPNFIRKFKKETGHTPGQYRKLYSENKLRDSNPNSDDL
ncbi:helix-turn-helix domain-containing protein [Paenibacillus sp. CMAA1364]